jgi:NADH:ubiquinone oxidoreductase subunit 2 (subunit N)
LETRLETVSSVLAYYFLAYGVSSLISFTIVSSEEVHGHFTIKDYAGFSKRSPGKALALALALIITCRSCLRWVDLSVNSIFSTKLFKMGMASLVILAVLTSLISLGTT